MSDPDIPTMPVPKEIDAELAQVIEALIFAAEQPISAATIAEVCKTVTALAPPSEDRIEAIIETLNTAYAETGRAFRIHRWAGGYRMATVSDVAPYLQVLYAERGTRRLSKSLLETLSVVAYQQPVSKSQIDFVRGVDTGYALKKLMEQDFIRIVGRAEGVGRPLLYGTTNRFLERFALHHLEDLPKLREIEELLHDPALQTRPEIQHLNALQEAPDPNLQEAAQEPPTNGHSDSSAPADVPENPQFPEPDV